MKIKKLQPEFVKHLPDKLSEGVLYISEEFATAGHLCCCGCGEEIFTPLNQAQWRLTKNKHMGTVSLYPSIGNWKYPCRSHYWIESNIVKDAGPMSERVIRNVIQRDRREKDRYIKIHNQQVRNHEDRPGYLFRLVRWLLGK